MACIFRLSEGKETVDSQSKEHLQLTVFQTEDDGGEVKTTIVRIPKDVFRLFIKAWISNTLPSMIEVDRNGPVIENDRTH